MTNPFQTPAAPTSQTISDIVGTPVLSNIAFTTRQLPWYARHSSEGNVFELFLFALFSVGSSVLRQAPTETESALGHSGSIICARTHSELVFVSGLNESTPARVLRRFPFESLTDCTRTKRHAVTVNFRFETGDDLTLEFYGNNKKLIAFTDELVGDEPRSNANE